MTSDPAARARSTRRRSRRCSTAAGPTCAATPARTWTTPTSSPSTARPAPRPASGSPAPTKKLADDRPRRAWASRRSTAARTTSAASVVVDRDAGLRRPVADGQGRRAVGPVRRRRRSCSAPSGTTTRTCATSSTLDLLGCFAMTETGHGSDVQQLRTTCTYDPATADLRPAHPARGRPQGLHRQRGPGRPDGRRLRPADHRRAASHGVHAWLVPIRDDARRRPLPGVTIGDDGPKAGLQRRRQRPADLRPRDACPRDMLLDRYGQVAADGTYTSSIENETRRFFTMLGTLVRGRVSVGGSAGVGAPSWRSTSPSATATSAASSPRPATDREIVVNDYLVHQRKLLPALATTYALHFAQERAGRHDARRAGRAHGTVDEDAQRELESRAAGLKAAQTWHATRTIQMCREACGGAGLPAGEPAAAPQGRHRRLHHLRGRQHRPAAAGRQGPAHRLPRRVRLAGRLGHGSASSPTWSARRCWSGRRPAR